MSGFVSNVNSDEGHMLCFDVLLNGERMWTAGVDRLGELFAVVSTSSQAVDPEADTTSVEDRAASIEAVAVHDRHRSTWKGIRQLRVGDTISILLRTSEVADRPNAIETIPVTVRLVSAETTPVTEVTCTFCHRPRDNDRPVVAGPPVYICSECVVVSSDLLRRE